MFSPFEQKLIYCLRGAFTFFLTCILLAASTSYAMQKDMPTAILFGVCGLAQMALALMFPGRPNCPYQNTNGVPIVDPGASCATDFPAGRSKPGESTETPSPRR